MSAPATAPRSAVQTESRNRGTGLKRRQVVAAYILVAPFFVVFLTMLVLPLFYSGYLSFFREQLVGGTVAFTGAGNYVRALHDQVFFGGVLRVMRFMVIQVPIMLGLALVFALALDSGRLRLQRAIRLSIFVPYAVPSVIAALMWGYLYGPDFGPFAQVARAVGLPTPPFLGSWMLESIMNIATWSFVGYNMIIHYAALSSIPAELYEAARVDGAGEFRVAWSIKIPAIRPALLLTAIFSVIGSFQLFNEPNLLRILAPNVIGVGYTPNLYAYNLAFINQEINYSAAIAFLLGFVIMIVSYVVQLSTQRRARHS